MVQRSDLQCDARGISYDFETRTGRLDMAPGNACDMSGCIDLFFKIDPKVKTIQTFAGDVPDTSYHRIGKATAWSARPPKE